MKAPFSPYLTGIAPGLKQLIALLRRRYDYVSVLSTDSVGFTVRISQRYKGVARDTRTTERGTVVRVYKDGLYSEAAFTGFNPADPEGACASLTASLDAQLELLKETGTAVYETAALPDEPETIFVEMETGRLPEEEDLAGLVTRLSEVSDKAVEQSAELLQDVPHGAPRPAPELRAERRLRHDARHAQRPQ